MKLKQIAPYAFSLVILLACDKSVDLPEPGNPIPVFTNEMTIDGQVVNWAAGVNEYNAIADFREIDNELVFSSYIKPADCDNRCPSSLEILLGSIVLRDSSFSMGDALQLGSMDFFERTTAKRDSLRITIKNTSVGRATREFWTLKDGTKIQATNFRDSVRFVLPFQASYSICLVRIDEDGNEAQQCQTFRQGERDVPTTIIRVLDPQRLALEAVPQPPYDDQKVTGMWNYNRNQKDKKISIKPSDIKAQSFCYSSRLGGVEGESCLKINGDLGKIGLTAAFELVAFKIKEKERQWQQKASIRYFDDNGEMFTSDFERNVNERFSIMELEPFEDPITNQKLLKATIEFRAKLRNVDGSKWVDLEKGQATIPIIDLD